jgi:hypothetical protein
MPECRLREESFGICWSGAVVVYSMPRYVLVVATTFFHSVLTIVSWLLGRRFYANHTSLGIGKRCFRTIGRSLCVRLIPWGSSKVPLLYDCKYRSFTIMQGGIIINHVSTYVRFMDVI